MTFVPSPQFGLLRVLSRLQMHRSLKCDSCTMKSPLFTVLHTLSVALSSSIIHCMLCVLFFDHFTSSDDRSSALPPSTRGHTHTQCSSGVCEWGGSKNRTGPLTHDWLMRQGGEEGRWMERGVYVGV